MNKKKEIFKEIIWLFIIGCFIGFLLETFWYYFKHGFFINKQGLLYGPFKPIYGLGVLIITFVFSKIKNKNGIIIFLLGILIGSLYEYTISMFQEYVLRTSTWNYSNFNLNINGRIYLPYCIGWGFISLIWIKFLYPKFKKLISYIPLFLSIIVAIFMLCDIILSGLAVFQYSNRMNNINYHNKVLAVIDNIYDDETISKKFPKLKAVKKLKND
jgi:uncharacterized membrane protein